MKPDGNCLFRSLAFIRHEDQELYQKVKEHISDHLLKYKDELIVEPYLSL
jgi:hypothetical protein